MKNIMLRPHHIDEIFIHRNMEQNVKEDAITLMHQLYGNNGFAEKYFEFIAQIDDETTITVVPNNDLICNYLGCPYKKLCDKEDYKSVVEEVVNKMPLGTPPQILEAMKLFNPEIGDQISMRKYGLKLWGNYKFKDIKVVNPNPPLEDLLYK